MARSLLVALVLHVPAVHAVDLEVAPIGTAVSGSFELGGRLTPLPEGNFQLAARSINEPTMLEGSIAIPRAKIAHVILVNIRPPALRAAVHARASLKMQSYRGFNWSGEPCKRDDTLYRADLTGSHGEDENCLLVDHGSLNLGPRAQGIWKDAATWLAGQNVQLVLPVMITAHVTRFQNTQLVAASYAFNPRLYGCQAPVSRSYTDSPWHKKQIGDDPQRVRFVDSVTAWGKMVQGHFDALVAGKASTVENRPSIYSCRDSQVVLSDAP